MRDIWALSTLLPKPKFPASLLEFIFVSNLYDLYIEILQI